LADDLVQSAVGARTTVTSERVDGSSREAALRKAERAQDAFLGEVRAELGVDTPADRLRPAEERR
jgi:hypothetical protein